MMINRTTTEDLLIMFLSVLVSFIFLLTPFGGYLSFLKPDLLTLILIYWIINVPNKIGIIFCFCIGLLLDLTCESLFGTTAIVFSIMAFLVNLLRRRIIIYRDYMHSTIVVLSVLGISHLLYVWLKIITGYPMGNSYYWLISLSSAVVWPLVYKLMNKIRTKLSIL